MEAAKLIVETSRPLPPGSGTALASCRGTSEAPTASTPHDQTFRMDLNTITEVARPRNRSEMSAWSTGDAWLAGGTWLFSEPQPALSRLIDLIGPRLAGDGRLPGRPRNRGDLHRRRARCPDLAAGMGGSAAHRPMLPRLPRLVQDLEHGDGRRQHLHGAAGGTDDLAHRGPRRHLHHLDAGRRRAPRRRHRLRARSPAQRAAARRAAARDHAAGRRARAAHRVSQDFALAARPLRRTADRNARAQRRLRAHRHGIDAAPGAARLPRAAVGRGVAATHRARPSPRPNITTTCTAPRSGGGT